MTGPRNNLPRIPSRPKVTNDVLKRDLNTSRTTDGPRLEPGTAGLGIPGIEYEDIPPPRMQHSSNPQNWTLEKVGSYLGIVTIVITVIIFFYRMDSNVSAVKTDVKEGKDKIEKLDEKAAKQISAIESVTNSVQRLEGEIRRTQDYVRDRKK